MTTAADREHWVDPADADRKGFWIFGHLLLVTIGIILVAFIVWADNAYLDIVTRGQGKVIPSSRDPAHPEPGRRHHGGRLRP